MKGEPPTVVLPVLIPLAASNKCTFALLVAGHDVQTSSNRGARRTSVMSHRKVRSQWHAQSVTAQLPSAATAVVPSNTRIRTKRDARRTTRFVFVFPLVEAMKIQKCTLSILFWAIGHWQCTSSEGLRGQAR